jgi:hypothetical protein
MNAISSKRRAYHVVVRDLNSNRVIERTRLRLNGREEAVREFERLVRERKFYYDYYADNTDASVRMELYHGPSPARSNVRLIAIAGNFQPPEITTEFGVLHLDDGIEVNPRDRHISDQMKAALGRMTDPYHYRRRALAQLDAGLPIADILPGGKDHDKSVAEEIGYLGLLNDPTNDLGPELRQRWSESLNGEQHVGSSDMPRRPQPIRLASDFELAAWSGALNDGASSSRKQMMAGHITQVPVESGDEVRKTLTEGKEGPAPKRTGPIRIMSEAEYRPGTPGLLSPEVVDELMKMSEPPQHSALLDRVLMAPMTPGELNVIQATGRQERLHNFINHSLAPFGVILKPAEKELSVKEHADEVWRLVQEGVARGDIILERDQEGKLTGKGIPAQHVDKIRDFTYPMWLRQRDRDVELAATRTSVTGPSTMDKIRHNCEDPKSVEPLTLLWHPPVEYVPVFKDGKQVFNEDGTPAMMIGEASQLHAEPVRLSEVVDPSIDIAATYPQNPADDKDNN